MMHETYMASMWTRVHIEITRYYDTHTTNMHPDEGNVHASHFLPEGGLG